MPIDQPTASVCVDPDVWLSDVREWSVPQQTACGDKPRRARLKQPISRELEERARKDSDRDSAMRLTFFVDFEPDDALAQTNVWYVPPTDAPLEKDVKITIGSATQVLPKGRVVQVRQPLPLVFFDLACAGSPVVKVDDRTVGTLKLEDGKTPKGLIINERGCMRLSNVLYSRLGDVGGPSGFVSHFQAPLYPLEHIDRIDHLLEAAPASKNIGGDTSVVELTAVPCPTK